MNIFLNKTILIILSLSATSVALMYLGVYFGFHYILSGLATLLITVVPMFFYIELEKETKLRYLLFIIVATIFGLLADLVLLLSNSLTYNFPIENLPLFLLFITTYGFAAWLNVLGYPVFLSVVFLRNNNSIFKTTITSTLIFTTACCLAEQKGIVANWWNYPNMPHIEYGLPYFVMVRYILMFLPLGIFISLIERYNSYKNCLFISSLYGIVMGLTTAVAYYYFT